MTKNQVQTAKLKKLCEEIVEVVNEITSESPAVEFEYLRKLEVDIMYYRSLLSLFFTTNSEEQKERILNLLRDSIIR